MSIEDAKKWSYTCNSNKKTKCSNMKWKKVRSRYLNNDNFDFKSRTKNLLEMKYALDELKVPFFLTHGALLGAYRDNDFIPWDDDIEIDIFEEIFLENYDKICNKLIKLGFIIRGRHVKYKKEKGEKINLYRNKEKISIRGLYLDPDYENNKYRLTNVFQYLRKFYDNHYTIEFKNVIFKTPGPIEDFLTYRYGSNWKIPIDLYSTKKKLKQTNSDSYQREVRRPMK